MPGEVRTIPKPETFPSRNNNGPNFDEKKSIDIENVVFHDDCPSIDGGLYDLDKRFFRTVCNLVGYVFRVKTSEGKIFEGILETFDPNFHVALSLAHEIQEGNEDELPHDAAVKEKMIFSRENIVTLSTVADADTFVARKIDFATDSEIGRYNGEVQEKALEAWEPDTHGDGDDHYIDYEDGHGSTGWTAEEMFERNKNFGVVSTYNEGLTQFSNVEISGDESSAEYQARLAEAERIALDIQSNPASQMASKLENDDEERDLTSHGAGSSSAPPPPPPHHHHHPPSHHHHHHSSALVQGGGVMTSSSIGGLPGAQSVPPPTGYGARQQRPPPGPGESGSTGPPISTNQSSTQGVSPSGGVLTGSGDSSKVYVPPNKRKTGPGYNQNRSNRPTGPFSRGSTDYGRNSAAVGPGGGNRGPRGGGDDFGQSGSGGGGSGPGPAYHSGGGPGQSTGGGAGGGYRSKFQQQQQNQYHQQQQGGVSSPAGQSQAAQGGPQSQQPMGGQQGPHKRSPVINSQGGPPGGREWDQRRNNQSYNRNSYSNRQYSSHGGGTNDSTINRRNYGNKRFSDRDREHNIAELKKFSSDFQLVASQSSSVGTTPPASTPTNTQAPPTALTSPPSALQQAGGGQGQPQTVVSYAGGSTNQQQGSTLTNQGPSLIAQGAPASVPTNTQAPPTALTSPPSALQQAGVGQGQPQTVVSYAGGSNRQQGATLTNQGPSFGAQGAPPSMGGVQSGGAGGGSQQQPISSPPRSTNQHPQQQQQGPKTPTNQNAAMLPKTPTNQNAPIPTNQNAPIRTLPPDQSERSYPTLLCHQQPQPAGVEHYPTSPTTASFEVVGKVELPDENVKKSKLNPDAKEFCPLSAQYFRPTPVQTPVATGAYPMNVQSPSQQVGMIMPTAGGPPPPGPPQQAMSPQPNSGGQQQQQQQQAMGGLPPHQQQQPGGPMGGVPPAPGPQILYATGPMSGPPQNLGSSGAGGPSGSGGQQQPSGAVYQQPPPPPTASSLSTVTFLPGAAPLYTIHQPSVAVLHTNNGTSYRPVKLTPAGQQGVSAATGQPIMASHYPGNAPYIVQYAPSGAMPNAAGQAHGGVTAYQTPYVIGTAPRMQYVVPQVAPSGDNSQQQVYVAPGQQAGVAAATGQPIMSSPYPANTPYIVQYAAQAAMPNSAGQGHPVAAYQTSPYVFGAPRMQYVVPQQATGGENSQQQVYVASFSQPAGAYPHLMRSSSVTGYVQHPNVPTNQGSNGSQQQHSNLN